MAAKVQTNVRLAVADRERLDRLAEARGATRSEVVRHLLAAADDEPLPEPPRREELLSLLGEAARGGSVRAIELLLMRRWEGRPAVPPWAPDTPDETDKTDPFREVDDLRQRRESRRFPLHP